MRFQVVLLLLMVCSVASFGQQVADPDFKAKVARPAYSQKGPQVLFDEAHFNFHTTTGRYQPFATLLTNDGYQVTPNKKPISPQTLVGFDVLVIANALGAAQMSEPSASHPAFSVEECAAIKDWVSAGGALLLIADHAPMGAAAERLSMQFSVEMSNGYTRDSEHYFRESNNQGFIQFNRENGLLGEHAITRGRTPDEQITHVQSFTGQSLKGPKASTVLLKLADSAIDLNTETKVQTSAAGRAQAIALPFGKGRVVIMGEAAMLSAQLAGPQKIQFGMNQPSLDNQQFALNVMHWLSGILQ